MDPTPKPTRPRRLRLGDLLIADGVITREQFEEAIAIQQRSGKRLGQVIVERRWITEEALNTLLARQLGVPFIELRQLQLEPEIVQRIPEAMARRHRVVALREEDDAILLGMVDPTNLFGYDEVAAHLRQPVRIALVSEAALLAALDLVYRRTDEMTLLAQEVREDLQSASDQTGIIRIDEGSPDAPVLKLLNSMFEDAVQVRASDIHIEPSDRGLRIRQRIDGVLQEHMLEGNRVSSALVSRLKLMCGLDIAEKRLPQDGRFSLKVRGTAIDVRVSTLPTQGGESAVMRLLDQSSSILPLDKIGLADDVRERLTEIIQRSAGMLLVTGPTGSGKTTTLYSALSHLNTPDVKIITVEDPVEYRLDRVCQVQVSAKIGLDFARVLRTILRQDPDIVLVGEMRDRETAEIGLRAAITGHFVMSTLHTATAVGAVNRLIDMGAEGYMIAASVQAVLAQRLLRRVCTDCAAPATLAASEAIWLRAHAPTLDLQQSRFVRGKGCSYCNGTGYRGRIAVHELLELDRALADAVRAEDFRAIEQAARTQAGFVSLTSRALQLAMQSVTTVAEVITQLSGLEEMRSPGRATDQPEANGAAAELSAAQAEALIRAGR